MHIISIVTYMFIHVDFVQLVLSCFAIWAVGSIMGREIGSARFGIVFIASGAVAGGGHIIADPSSVTLFVGASGAVFGLLATLFLLMPFKRT